MRKMGIQPTWKLLPCVGFIATQVATSALALGSWTALKPVARRLILDSRRMASTVESLVADEAPAGDEEE